MKYLERVFCLIVVSVVLVACEAPRVPSQSTAPIVNQAITDIPSSIPEQITFPQMTGTALAFPTVPFVIEPTQTPALPGVNDPVVISPNGLYAIACKDPFFILFDTQTNAIVSTFNYFPVDCLSDIHWASDSSYALFGVLYRWHTDGSQPEFLDINTEVKLNYPDCGGQARWSHDGQYLAIHECDLYVVMPFNEESLKKPLMVAECASCFYDFQWATPQLLMLDHHRTYTFYNVLEDGTGKSVGWWDKDGMGCIAQPPSISPNERWVVFDVSQYQCGISGPGDIYQYSMVDLETGSIQIFSDTFGNLIDFIGWSQDSQEFYMISRPINSNITADPRTPFGLLVLNPGTLQGRNLFEQAWYISFNQDMSWAYVVFPAKDNDGKLRFDGALWQIGSTELIGRQTMFYGIPDDNLYPGNWSGYMYSATGEELAYSAQTRSHPQVAFWSHDNDRVAIINERHELVTISLAGAAQVIGKLNVSNNWYYPVITWSEDDKVLELDGITWPAP